MDGFPESKFPPGTIKAVSLAVPAMAELVGKELKGWVTGGWVVVFSEGWTGTFKGIYLLLKTSNKWWFWLFDCRLVFYMFACLFVRSLVCLLVYSFVCFSCRLTVPCKSFRRAIKRNRMHYTSWFFLDTHGHMRKDPASRQPMNQRHVDGPQRTRDTPKKAFFKYEWIGIFVVFSLFFLLKATNDAHLCKPESDICYYHPVRL